ncbi:iduronate-2-sulfatase [Nitrosopumilus zosterae]|uniref:Iduronate-2-sulfatase n=1 Tax=Nitrosopumilus zosterae TaxID=718286 RepID=A0A2S2KUM3_9ARCH|nr:sulfatase-like hydrolase/transferase [Nitrosopumilus zosterae]BDQ31798.1 sulfatase-like hydrolase/transferase [Nitrosopumilus zosterae]GBH35148.1 iduronate-2-sulfatase [Nitrosopumilus zosterae]
MKPNILLLTIDSLRADKIYGKNKSSLTPNIDNLIKNGLCFTQAISTSDTTGLSIGSLVTAKYPFKTGITHFSYDNNTQTYFQILKDNGYKIYATIPDSSFFLKMTANMTETDAYVYDKRESWLQLVGGIGEQIVKRLEKNLTEPWFYYIHLMDLHAPFYVPKEFDSEKFGKTPYDRMISAIDSWIGKFFEKIDLKKTLLIISADHGDHIPVVDDWGKIPKVNILLKKGKQKLPILEPLGLRLFVAYQSLKRKYKSAKLSKELSDRELIALEGRGQNHLFDELIRIPLIFTGFGINYPKIITNQVKQVDIFPTIVDLVEISSNIKNIDGQSLVPLISNPSQKDSYTYIETGARNFKNAKNPTLHGNIIGLRTPKYKYWRSRNDSTKNVTLYDLENDPNEENNIAEKNQSVVISMEEIIVNMKKNSIPIKYEISKDDEGAIEEELKKMGYM